MPAITFDSSDYEGVRKLISLSLGSDVLPDTVLELDVYSGAAIRFVATRTGNTDSNAKHAAVLYTAILVLPSVPQMVSESEAGYSYTLKALDVAARTAQLYEMFEDAIRASETAAPTDVAAAYDAGTNVLGFDAANAPASWPPLPLAGINGRF